MEAERTGGSSLGVYIVLVQLSVKTPGMLHMGSLVILEIVRKKLDKNVEVGIVHNKFALLWGEAQKKIAYCFHKVT